MNSIAVRPAFSVHPGPASRRIARWLTLAAVAVAAVVLVPRSARAQGASLTTLHSFAGTDGSNPNYDARLLQATDGNFYGTTVNGGAGGYGTVFKITAAGALTTVYNFNGGTDGRYPYGGLIQGTDGNFYGTTNQGGTGGYGTVFQLTPAGALTTLHGFAGGNDGAYPQAGLLKALDGTFYGTTYSGGTSNDGTIYKITPTGVVTILFAFGGSNGAHISCRLVQTSNGYVFGTTYYGGTNYYDGSIFRFSPGGTFTTLYNFSYTDGGNPVDGLIVGGDGNLYGTTANGGSGGDGTVFRLNPNTGTLSTIHTFNGDNGRELDGSLLQASDGNFYGTTRYGGSGYSNGTVFRLTLDGTLTTIYEFSGGSDGQSAYAGVIEGTDHRLYGVTQNGGVNGDGTVFRLNASGNLQFAAAAYSVDEAAGNVVITVSRAGGSIGTASVRYATGDGTALAGRDYGAVSGTFNWANGDATDRTLTVPITNELLYNGARTFTVTLSGVAGNASLGLPSQTLVTINDNDPPPQPTVTLTDPPDGLVVAYGGDVPLSADVVDPAGILDRVEFYANGTDYLGQVSAPGPYVLDVTNFSNGTDVITANAIDTQNRTSISESHTLTVAAYDPNYVAPAVTILTDLSTHEVAAGSTLPVSVSAVPGDDTPLQRVDFYADGVRFASFDGAGNPLALAAPNPVAARPGVHRDASGISTTFAASFVLPGASKIVNLVALALSQTGLGQFSPAVSVQSALSTDQPPQVALSSAVTSVQVNQAVSVPVTINATGTVTRVEYYVNATKVKDSAAAPYTLDFTPTEPGPNVLTVIATDAAGLAGVSVPVTVQAAQTPEVSVAALGGGAVTAGSKGKVRFTRANGDTTGDLIVRYKTAGSAQKDVDYAAPSGTATIPAGLTSVKVKIKTLTSAQGDGSRQIVIKLLPSQDGGYTKGAPSKAKLTIYGG